MKKVLLLAIAGFVLAGCAEVQTGIKYASDPNAPASKINQATSAVDAAARQAAVVANDIQKTQDLVASITSTASTKIAQLQAVPSDLKDQLQVAVLNPIKAVRTQVKRGDCLWGLSKTYYGTGFLWPLVCTQNGIQDCQKLEVGQSINFAYPTEFQAYPKSVLDQYKKTAYNYQ